MSKALAQAVNVASTTALHTVGERYIDGANGKEYVYVLAGGAITLGDVCSFNQSHSAQRATSTLVNSPDAVGIGVATASIAAASYGWLQIYGANAAIHCGNGAYKANGWGVDVTAGRLVNSLGAATGGGKGRLSGIFSYQTCFTAGATVAGYLNFPRKIHDTGEV